MKFDRFGRNIRFGISYTENFSMTLLSVLVLGDLVLKVKLFYKVPGFMLRVTLLCSVFVVYLRR